MPGENWWEFNDRIYDEFGPSSMSVVLLSVMASIYPVLADQVGALSAPIVVIVNTENVLQKLSGILNCFEIRSVYALSERPGEIKKITEEDRGGMAVYRFLCGRYTAENAQHIVNRMGEIRRKPHLPTLYSILSVGSVPENFRMFFSGFIFVNGESRRNVDLREITGNFLRELIEFVMKTGQKRSYIMTEAETDEFEIDMALFCAARWLLLDFLWEAGVNEEDLDRIADESMNAIRKMDEEWHCENELESYAVALRKLLWEACSWLSETMLDRTSIEGDEIDQIEAAIFYDADAYYFPLPTFKKICSPMLQNVSFDYIKSRLADAGVLVTEGRSRNYCTKKIELITVFGAIWYKRLVKLRRDRVDLPGELTFLEKMQERRTCDG